MMQLLDQETSNYIQNKNTKNRQKDQESIPLGSWSDVAFWLKVSLIQMTTLTTAWLVFHGSKGNFNCFDTSSPLVPLKIVPLFALRWINALRSFVIDFSPFLLALLFLVFWTKSRSDRNNNHIFLLIVYFLKISFTSILAHCWLRAGIFFDGFAVQINPWYLLKCLCCRVSWVVWKK